MRFSFFLFYFFVPLLAIAQKQVSGQCFSEQYKKISFPSITLLSDSSNQIRKFVIGDIDGKFTLKISDQQKEIRIKISAVGYADSFLEFSFDDNSEIKRNIILKSATRLLNEVVVHAEKAIVDKGDTISIKSKFFSDGSETVLEDLLKKMPGLDIASDGVIRVNGKEIEKIMVEGDDFFDKGYKLLSKNMPPGVVDKVEIIQRYEAQRLRKGLKESDKIALNLRLTDDAKHKWFGNVDVNASPVNPEYYAGRVNLMNFKKKSKYYILGASNSVGQNIDISLVDQMGGVSEDIDNENERNNFLYPTVSFMPQSNGLPTKKYSFNRMLLNSANIILRPFANTKLRIGINRLSDKIETNQALQESVLLKDTAFINNESYLIHRMPVTYLGKLNWQTEIDSSTSFSADIYWLGILNKENAITYFNTKPLLEQNRVNHHHLSYKATLTKRISETKFLQISFAEAKQDLPIQYTNQPFLPTSFFNLPATVNSLQRVQQYRNDINSNLSYVHKLSNSAIVETYVGFNAQITKQFVDLSFNNKDSIYNSGNDFNGNYSLNQQKIFAKINLNKKWKSLSVIPSFEITFIKQVNTGYSTNTWTNSFVNPSLTVGYQLNKKHKFIGIFGVSNNVPNFDDIQPFYRMSGFRSFQRGSNTVQSILQSTNMLSYTLGNWADRFFINVFYLGIIDHNFLGTNMIIDPTIIFSEKIWLENKQAQSLNANADLFVKQINNNLKLTTVLSNSTFYNVVNGSSIRKIETTSLSVGLEAKSVFKGFYNHHFGLKRVISRNETEQRRNFIFHTSFLDFYFKLNKWGNLKIRNEGFHFPKEQVSKAFLVFSDIEWSRTMIEGKCSVGLSVTNLMNQTEFTTVSLSDISVTKNTTTLLPRILLLKMEYRF
ncbi:MAG: hypothetical protein RL596_1531 [Bacteroidota bacterium]